MQQALYQLQAYLLLEINLLYIWWKIVASMKHFNVKDNFQHYKDILMKRRLVLMKV